MVPFSHTMYHYHLVFFICKPILLRQGVERKNHTRSYQIQSYCDCKVLSFASFEPPTLDVLSTFFLLLCRIHWKLDFALTRACLLGSSYYLLKIWGLSRVLASGTDISSWWPRLFISFPSIISSGNTYFSCLNVFSFHYFSSFSVPIWDSGEWNFLKR